MILINTEKLMRTMQAEKRFEDCGILVSVRGERKFLSTENVNEDTLFDVASMGKVLVTSTLILRAIGENRLSLEDTLPRFFDDVPADKQGITIKQMLTHSSGMIRFEFPPETARMTHDEIAAMILKYPLNYQPGKGYQYCCNAYILLGFIAEKVFDDTLDRLFERMIKEPLGLTRSRFNIAPYEENSVVSYRRWEPGEYRTDDPNVCLMHGVAGSGASFWTTADMEKFALAVLRKSDKLYARELFELAETDYNPADRSEGRGLGYLIVNGNYPQTEKLFPVGSFGHCGHTGMSLFISREKDMFVLISTNATRCNSMQYDFKKEEYGFVCQMRRELHRAIRIDLEEEGR